MSAEPERRVWRSPVPNAKYHIYRPDECLRGEPRYKRVRGVRRRVDTLRGVPRPPGEGQQLRLGWSCSIGGVSVGRSCGSRGPLCQEPTFEYGWGHHSDPDTPTGV